GATRDREPERQSCDRHRPHAFRNPGRRQGTRRRCSCGPPSPERAPGRLNARAWVFTAEGRLRAPWRILCYLAATYCCGLIAANFLAPAIGFLYSAAGLRVSSQGWVIVAALLGGHAVVLRFVDHRPWSDVWLDRQAACPAL